MEKIAEKIKERRALLNVTQEDVAQIADVSIRTIKEIESGRANPSIGTLTKIVDVLGMEIVVQIKTYFE